MREKNIILILIIFMVFIISGCKNNNSEIIDLGELLQHRTNSVSNAEITEKQFVIKYDKVIIDLNKNVHLVKGIGKSMYPSFLNGSIAIAYDLHKNDELNVADFVVLHTTKNMKEISFIHMIVEKGNDNRGIYYITSGENNINPDKIKLRAENITEKIVGVFR